MHIIEVGSAGAPYQVRIGPGALEASLPQLADLLGKRQKIWIVADIAAQQQHGQRLTNSFQSMGLTASWHEVGEGEGAKSWAQLEKLTDWLLAEGVTRHDHVFAFGGGVVGDLTGFACAIVKRGCGFVQLPTTLLAQVDSSVGGKTGINASAGKNLIGAFHQPAMVIADTDWLTTLPLRQVRAGYAEVLKYGVLGDPEFFHWLVAHGEAVIAGEQSRLVEAIARSVDAKARIVAEDERETTGRRALLNLGHTFGHALEAATGFSDRLLHGEAVALGIVLAARYSARRGHFSLTDALRIERAVEQVGLPSTIGALRLNVDGASLVRYMRHDKKAEADTLPFVLLREIGAAYLARDVVLADVSKFLDEELQAH